MTRLDWLEYGWQWTCRILGLTGLIAEFMGPGRGFIVAGAITLMGFPSVYNLGRK